MGEDIAVKKEKDAAASDVKDAEDGDDLHADVSDRADAAQYDKAGNKSSGNSYQMGGEAPGRRGRLCQGIGLGGASDAESSAYGAKCVKFGQRFMTQAIFQYIHGSSDEKAFRIFFFI